MLFTFSLCSLKTLETLKERKTSAVSFILLEFMSANLVRIQRIRSKGRGDVFPCLERVNVKSRRTVGGENRGLGGRGMMDDTDAGREIGRALEDAQSKATELQAKIMQFQVEFSSQNAASVEQALEQAGNNFLYLSSEISPLLQSIIRCEVAVRSQLNLLDVQLSTANCHTPSEALMSETGTPNTQQHVQSSMRDEGQDVMPNNSDASEKDMADAVLSQLNTLLQQVQHGHSGSPQ